MEYVVFSDESRHTEGRYRGIAAVSFPMGSKSAVVRHIDDLAEVLECSKKGELKWRNVGRHGKKNVPRAIAAIDFLFRHLGDGFRLDVLIWDTRDARHDLNHRDDTANYDRMFFHLHRHLMSRRGPHSIWHVRPDRLLTAGWETIANCLNSDGTWTERAQADLAEPLRWLVPTVRTWKEVDSECAPFVQLADLTVGMGTYARTEAQIVRQRRDEAAGQNDLFTGLRPDGIEPSLRDRGRFRVISHFHDLCRDAKLGVGFRDGYFRTRDPKSPINFWHYEPQHGRDRAPTKDWMGLAPGSSPARLDR